jgi:hypothetical protein
MSWDVMIFNLRDRSTPPSVQSLEEADVKPLGPADKVRRDIATVLPGIDWSEPNWGRYRDRQGALWIEFNAGRSDPIMHMMLHVRGSGDAIAAIMAVTRPHGWSAVDCSTGEFLDPREPSDAGWRSFQAFRDKVIGPGGPVEIGTEARTTYRQLPHDARMYAARCSWFFGHRRLDVHPVPQHRMAIRSRLRCARYRRICRLRRRLAPESAVSVRWLRKVG